MNMSEEVSWQHLMGIDNSTEDGSISPILHKNKWSVHRKTNNDRVSENSHHDNGESITLDESKKNNRINSVSVTKKKDEKDKNSEEEIVYYSPIKTRSAKRKIFEHPLSGSISPHKPSRKRSRTKNKFIFKETSKQVASSSSERAEKIECDANIEIPQSSKNNFPNTPISLFSSNIKRKLIYSTNKLKSRTPLNNININDFYKSVIMMEEADKVPPSNKCRPTTSLATDNFVKFSSLLNDAGNLNVAENNCKMSLSSQVEGKTVIDKTCNNFVLNDSLNNFQFTEVEEQYYPFKIQKQGESFDALPNNENISQDNNFNELEHRFKNNLETSEFDTNNEEQAKNNYANLINASNLEECSFSSSLKNKQSEFSHNNENSIRFDETLIPQNVYNCEPNSQSEDLFKSLGSTPSREYSKSNKEEENNSITIDSRTETKDILFEDNNISVLNVSDEKLKQHCVLPNLDSDNFSSPHIKDNCPANESDFYNTDKIIRSNEVCFNDLNVSCIGMNTHFLPGCVAVDSESKDLTESTDGSKAKVEALLQGILDKPSSTPIHRLLSEDFSDLNSTVVQFSTAGGSVVRASQESLDKAKVLMQEVLVEGENNPQQSLKLPRDFLAPFSSDIDFKISILEGSSEKPTFNDNADNIKPFSDINEINTADTSLNLPETIETVIENFDKSGEKISNNNIQLTSSSNDFPLIQNCANSLNNDKSSNMEIKYKEFSKSLCPMDSLQKDKLVNTNETILRSNKANSNDVAKLLENRSTGVSSPESKLQSPTNNNNLDEDYVERKSEYIPTECSYNNVNSDLKLVEPFQFSTAGGSVVPVSEESLRQVRAKAQVNDNEIELAIVSTSHERTIVPKDSLLNFSASSNSSAMSPEKLSQEEQSSSGSMFSHNKFFRDIEFSTEEFFSKESKINKNSKQNLNTSLSESFLIDSVNKTPITKTPFKSWKLTSSKKLLSLSSRSRRLSLSNSSSENSTPKNVSRKTKNSEEGWKSQFNQEIKRSKYEEEAERIVTSPEYDLRKQNMSLSNEHEISVPNKNVTNYFQTHEADSNVKPQKTQYLFKTAKGKKVNMKKDSLRRAKNKFKDELEPVIYQNEADYIIKSPEYDLKSQTVLSSLESLKSGNISQNTGCLFQTGNGNKINITKQSLRNAKKKLSSEMEPAIYQIDEKPTIESLQYDSQNQTKLFAENKYCKSPKRNVKFLTNECNVSIKSQEANYLFKTAKGSKINISRQSLRKAKKQLKVELDPVLYQHEAEYIVKSPEYDLQIKRHSKQGDQENNTLVSSCILSKVNSSFKDDLDTISKNNDLKPICCEFTPTEEQEDLITNENLERVKNQFKSEINHDNLGGKVDLRTCVKFSTANGREINISNKTYQKIKNLFKNELDLCADEESPYLKETEFIDSPIRKTEVHSDIKLKNTEDLEPSGFYKENNFRLCEISKTATIDSSKDISELKEISKGPKYVAKEETINVTPCSSKDIKMVEAPEKELTSKFCKTFNFENTKTNILDEKISVKSSDANEFQSIETNTILNNQRSTEQIKTHECNISNLENPVVLTNNKIPNEILEDNLQKVGLKVFKDSNNESKVQELLLEEEKFSLQSEKLEIIEEKTECSVKPNSCREYSIKSSECSISSQLHPMFSTARGNKVVISEKSLQKVKNLFDELDASTSGIHKPSLKKGINELPLRTIEKKDTEQNLISNCQKKLIVHFDNKDKGIISENSSKMIQDNFEDDKISTNIQKTLEKEDKTNWVSLKDCIESTLNVDDITQTNKNLHISNYEATSQPMLFSTDILSENVFKKDKNMSDEFAMKDYKEHNIKETLLKTDNEGIGGLENCAVQGLSNRPIAMFSTARSNDNTKQCSQTAKNIFNECSSSMNIQKSPPRLEEFKIPIPHTKYCKEKNIKDTTLTVKNETLKNCTEYVVKCRGFEVANQPMPMFSTARGNNVVISENSLQKVKNLFDELETSSSIDVQKYKPELPLSEVDGNSREDSLLKIDLEEFEKNGNFTQYFGKSGNSLASQIPSVASTHSQNKVTLPENSLQKIENIIQDEVGASSSVNIQKFQSKVENQLLPLIDCEEKNTLNAQNRGIDAVKDCSEFVLLNQSMPMFSTAGGKNVVITEKCLQKVMNLFDECDASSHLAIQNCSPINNCHHFPSTIMGKNCRDKSLFKTDCEDFENSTEYFIKSEKNLSNQVPFVLPNTEPESGFQKVNNKLMNEFDANSSVAINITSKQDEDIFTLRTVDENNIEENLLTVDREAFENFENLTQYFITSENNSTKQVPSTISTAIDNTHILSPKDNLPKVTILFKKEFDINSSIDIQSFLSKQKVLLSPVNECTEKFTNENTLNIDNCATEKLIDIEDVQKCGYDLINRCVPMLSTARGNKISVSENSLEKIKNLFKDELDASSSKDIIDFSLKAIDKQFASTSAQKVLLNDEYRKQDNYRITVEDELKEDSLSLNCSQTTMKSSENKIDLQLPPTCSTDVIKNIVISDNSLHKVLNIPKDEFIPKINSSGLETSLGGKHNITASTFEINNSKENLSKNDNDLIQEPFSTEQKNIYVDTLQKDNNSDEVGVVNNTGELSSLIKCIETQVPLCGELNDLEKISLHGVYASNPSNLFIKTSEFVLTSRLSPASSNITNSNIISENNTQQARDSFKQVVDTKLCANEIKPLELKEDSSLKNENNYETRKYENIVENTMKSPEYNLTGQSSFMFSTARGNKVSISEKTLNFVKNIFKEDFEMSCSTNFNLEQEAKFQVNRVEENIGEKSQEIQVEQSNGESSRYQNKAEDMKSECDMKTQNCMFLTANGKNVTVSEKSLQMVKGLFSDDLRESDIFDSNLMPELRQSASTSNKRESAVHGDPYSVDIVQNTDHGILNFDQSNVPTKLPFMFSTANGSSGTISRDSLLQATNMMKEDLESITDEIKQDATIDPIVPINNKSSLKPEFTFSTAIGNRVIISEESLKKVRSQATLTDSNAISTAETASVSYDSLHNVQNIYKCEFKVGNNIQPDVTHKAFLSNVSNTSVRISEDDIKNVISPFKDNVTSFSETTDIKGHLNNSERKFMFSSASGSSVSVSKKSLNLVRNKFKEDSGVCNYLEGSNKNNDSSSGINFNARENFGLRNIQDNEMNKGNSGGFIFSTAQGNKIGVSEKSLIAVKAQLNEARVVETQSDAQLISDYVVTFPKTPKSSSTNMENNTSQEKHDSLAFTPTLSGQFFDDELNRIENLVSQNRTTTINTPETESCAPTEGNHCDTPVTHRDKTKLNSIPNVPQRKLLYTSQEASNSAVVTMLKEVFEKPYVTSPSKINDRSHLMPLTSCEIEFGSDDDIFAAAESQTKLEPNVLKVNNDYSVICESISATEKRKSDTELTSEPISKKAKLSNELQTIDMEVIFREREVKRQEQNQKIISKLENHPPVSQGLYMNIRNKDSLLKFMEDPLNNPGIYSYEKLLELGLCSDVINVTSNNALDFKFDGHFFFNEECFSESGFIDLGSGFIIILSDDNKIGLKEISSAFLSSPNVDPSLVPEGWIKNHYRWIVWKLSSLEKSFPHMLSKRYLIPLNVLHQLKYRYDREIDLVQRPALRRILECDEASSRRFIARVCDLRKVEGDELDPAVELQLTDGWYGVWSTVDSAMRNLVKKGKVKVGTKLIIQGAEILNCGDGCDPLELKDSIRLKLSSNSVRRVKWGSRMGFTRYPGPLHVSLNSILPDGGTVGVTTALICRVYPLLFMSKDPNGKSVVRNSQAENQIAVSFEKQRNLKSEELYEQILAEVENKFKKGPKIKLDLKNLKRIMNPPALYRIITQEPEMHASLCPEQLDLVKNYHEEIKSKIQVEVQNTLQEKLKELAPQRQVTTLLKIRLVDPSTEFTALVTIWRPTEDLCSLLTENRCLDFHSLTASGMRDNVLQLSSSKMTHYKESKKFSKSPKYKRKLTELSELVSQKGNLHFCELDVVGVVVYVKEPEKPGGITNVYLSDLKDNFLMITFWTSLKVFGFEEVLKEGSIVAAVNLHWRHGSGSYVVPSTFANEFTYFSSHPSQGYILKEIADFKIYFSDEDLPSFVSGRKETLLNLLKDRCSIGSNTTPTRRVDPIGLSLHVAKRLEKLKSYGPATPLPKTSLLSGPDIRKSFKPPKINKVSDNLTSK